MGDRVFAFVGMMTLLFVTLKLTDNINWSWWWVLSPLWLFGTAILLLIIGAFSIAVADVRQRQRRNK